MSANTQSIFSNQGFIKWGTAITAANTALDGTGTVTTIATGNAAGNASGNFIQKIIARPLGTNVASVARIFVNNGSANSTAGNNALIAEVTLPAVTLSQVSVMTGVEIALNLVLPASYNLNATLGTAVAAGWMFTAIGGQY